MTVGGWLTRSKSKPVKCKICKKLFCPGVNASKKLTHENCRKCRKEIIMKEDFKSGIYK
jgi:hypothetical protein